MQLELPNGWVGLAAPSNLPLFAKWQAVSGARLPSALAAATPDEAHEWTLQRIAYEPEPGQRDFWQPPALTLDNGYGDCEDFVLLERALLLNGGMDDSLLAMLIVYDLVMRRDHALLWTPDCYLDCRTRTALSHDNFNEYRPIVAFAANEACIFGKRRG